MSLFEQRPRPALITRSRKLEDVKGELVAIEAWLVPVNSKMNGSTRTRARI